MRSRPSEILAPAGSLSAGVYALRGGADAVYLGLKTFSARAGARNFSIDEVSRLKALAASLGKKVYIALNTIIRDDEIQAAARLLYDLEAVKVDGIIIQDLGLLSLLRSDFPRLPVHASTQMGVHNSEGVAFLKAQGVRRFILSRELSHKEISEIRRAHPEVELEVFVHGALCYSFSGLCLASGLLLGRSGNRGECAQICRGWFETEDTSSSGLPAKGYFFSCNDLAVEDDILRLRDIGIDSFKIEGRLKPPEWVAAVSSYYKAVLEGLPPAEASGYAEKARLIFSRKQTRGFGPSAADITDSEYSGPRGLPAGKVKAVMPGMFSLKLETDLALRDGLLFFARSSSGGKQGLPRPVLFAAARLEKEGPGGRNRAAAVKTGEVAWISAPENPRTGETVYKVSSHDSALPEISEKLPPTPLGILIEAEISSAALVLTARRQDSLPLHTQESYSAQPEPASKPKPFRSVLENHLRAPGDSRFLLTGLSLKNTSSLPDDGIYINPSVLKEIRRFFYEKLETDFIREGHRRAANALHPSAADAAGDEELLPASSGPVPILRSEILDPVSGLPFLADPATAVPDDLPRDKEGRRCFALSPVLFDAEAYLAAAAGLTGRILRQSPEASILIGLGNAGHISFAQAYTEEARVSFFIDYGLYSANRRTLSFLAAAIPRLLYFYPWIEDPDSLPIAGGPPLAVLPQAAAYGSFRPPLFTGRSCVFRHAEPQSSCMSCSAGRSAVIKQGKKNFLLRTARIAGTCLNFLFEK